jgi:hypothetical protein
MRQEYRSGVRNGVEKTAGLKRAVSGKGGKMTQDEKDAVYRPKQMKAKCTGAKLLVYDPKDMDRMRKRKILDDVREQNKLRRSNSKSTKHQENFKSALANIAEKRMHAEMVAERNLQHGVDLGTSMPLPKVLGTVAAAKSQAERGETVVNITGKRRLSVILLEQSSKPQCMNCVCACFLFVAIAAIIAGVVLYRISAPP